MVLCLSFPSWKRYHKMKEQLEPSIKAAGKCVLREGTNTPGVVSPQKCPSGEVPVQWGASSIPHHPAEPRPVLALTPHTSQTPGDKDMEMVGLGWGLAQGSAGKMDQGTPGGKFLQPPKQGPEAAGTVVLGCLGRRAGRGLMLCHSGSPVLVDSSGWEKHFQEDFKQPRLFSPFSILPIPWEGGKSAGAALTHCSWVTLGQPWECRDVAGRGAGWHVAHFLRRSRKTPKTTRKFPLLPWKGH